MVKVCVVVAALCCAFVVHAADERKRSWWKARQVMVSFAANHDVVEAGDSVLLSWATRRARRCSAKGDWQDRQNIRGTWRTPPLVADARFELTCWNRRSRVTEVVEVRVVDLEPHSSQALAEPDAEPVVQTMPEPEPEPQPEPKPEPEPEPEPQPEPEPKPEPKPEPEPEPDPIEPTVHLTSGAAEVDSGEYVELNWSSSDATHCEAQGGWQGALPTSGSQLVGPLNATTTFGVTCTGAGGTAVTMLSVKALGRFALTWQAPVQNVDGTPAAQIAHYNVHYGPDAGDYQNVLEVTGDVTTMQVTTEVGAAYVAMTATDVHGQQSGLSNEVVKFAQ